MGSLHFETGAMGKIGSARPRIQSRFDSSHVFHKFVQNPQPKIGIMMHVYNICIYHIYNEHSSKAVSAFFRVASTEKGGHMQLINWSHLSSPERPSGGHLTELMVVDGGFFYRFLGPKLREMHPNVQNDTSKNGTCLG